MSLLTTICCGMIIMKNSQYEFYKVPQVDDLKQLIDYAGENYGERVLFNYEEETGKKAKYCDLHECEVI